MKTSNAAELRTRPVASPFADIVRAGLRRASKSLPPVLFYDAEGSRLFERITDLPEYYLTRTERGILTEHADEIVEACGVDGRTLHILELGSGSADKSVIVVAAAARRSNEATFWPSDVSEEALKLACENARTRAKGVQARPILGSHTEALARVGKLSGRKLVLFIGSSIGNYDDPDAIALLREVRAILSPGDALLLGADRKKSVDVLIPAYDDPAGVTAAFNKNVLVRLNRELGANFDVDRFRHVAVWNEAASCVSMFLESTDAQRVHVDALGEEFVFRRGERIHTENSMKYDDARLFDLLEAAGLSVIRSFSDARGWFGLHLARPR